MISTKGLELTNFINPDLTWKKVSKGYRSATRRSRKQLDADLPDKGPESPSDTTVSESEKLGVAVLGQRFREKVEHVPIKKRRFTVRSPSPPRNYSPQKKKDQEKGVEDKKQSCKRPNYSKKQLSSPVNAAPMRRRKVKPIINSEDFSGIEILAAAACDNSMYDEVSHEEKSITTKGVSTPLEEEVVLSKEITTRSPETDVVLEEGDGDQKNVTTEEKTVRFPWDLNLAVNDWEAPYESDSQSKQQVSAACELPKDTTIFEHVEQKVESNMCIDVNEDKCVPKDLALESSGVVSASELLEVKPCINLGDKQDADENSPKNALLGENGELKLPRPPNAEEEQVESSAGRVISEEDAKIIDDKDRNITKDIESGYDSQFEDGELRESTDDPQLYWEEDYEDRVDYGSDTCDDDNGSAVVAFGMQPTDCNEEEVKAERVLDSVGSHGDAGDTLRQQKPVGSKVNLSVLSDEFQRVSEVSSPNRVIVEGSEGGGCCIRKHSADDGFDGKDSPKASWKELPVIGESLSSETSNRNDSVLVQTGRSSNFDFYAQSDEARIDHSSGKERPDSQIHPVSPIGLSNPSANYWESRCRESPTFRGSFGSDRTRPRSSGYPMHSEGLVSGPPDNYGHRQTMNSFSNGSYRYPIRRRSPPNNIGNNRGMLPMRDVSPDRRRFRRYPQGIGRGFREYQQRPFNPNDSDEYSHHVPNRMVRRDQNSSPPPPIRGGPGPIYYRRPYKQQRSQSRSRSRSPGPWMSSRDRNSHNSSRSPDYRFEARMPRIRVPFQKQQSFRPKYDVGFVSPQRQRRFSPQHNSNGNSNNSRWFGDQNSDSFRGPRAPARPFQRFDSVGSSRRMNSDDYYEPPMRPGARYSDMGGRGRGNGGNGNGNGGGGGRRFDESDDERRRPDGGGRYEMYPRVKRCDSDGLRRARFDEDDSFVSRNNNNNNNNNNGSSNFDESEGNNNNSNSVGVGGGERRPRSVYMGELVKRKAS